jgi:hypothetical protein
MLAIRFDAGGKTIVGVQEAGPYTPPFGLIFRYNDDGTLDESYGQGGYEPGYLPPESDGGLSRIGAYNMWLPDEFAPTDAKVAHALGTPGAAVTQSDGRIVALVGAYTLDDRRDAHRAVCRFKADGTLDPTFANAVRWRGNWMPGQVLIQPGTGRIITGSGDGFRVVAVQSSPPLDQPLAVADAPPEATRTPLYPTEHIEGNVTEVRFSIRYEDDHAIDVASIDGNDVRVSLPSTNFYEKLSLPAEFVSVVAESGGAVCTATYRFVNPKGRDLPVSSGMYDLALVPGQVLDDAGNAVAGGSLYGGSYFVVDSTAPSADTTPAATVVSTTNVTDPATTAVRIVVHYEDDLAILGSTIDGNDVLVTAPDGSTAPATSVGGPFTGAHPQLDVTYEYVPAGGFTAEMSGAYRISVEGSQVWDTSGAAVPVNESAGTFSVNLLTDGPNLTAGPVTMARRLRTVVAGRRPRGSLWFDVTNDGNQPAAGNVSFAVFASTDDQVDAGDKQIAAATRRLSLRPGQPRRVRMRPGVIPPELAPGEYHLLARADVAEQVTETDESDNVGPSPTPVFHVTAPAARRRLKTDGLHAIEILREGAER